MSQDALGLLLERVAGREVQKGLRTGLTPVEKQRDVRADRQISSKSKR